MSIKKFVLSISVVIIACIILNGIVLGFLLQKNYQLREANERHFYSQILVTELRASSEELTRRVRNYAVTGDPAHERAYNKVIEVRSGQAPRPDDALVAPGEKHVLLDLLLAHGLTAEEFSKVETANALSDALVHLEVESMNAVKGIFQDRQGNYKLQREPDREKAVRLVFGPEYDAVVGKIMQPLDEFEHMVIRRTSQEVTRLQDQQRVMAVVVTASLVIVLLASFLSLVGLRRKMLKPLQKTTEFADEIANGHLHSRIEEGVPDEVGRLRRTLNIMVDSLKQRIQEAEEASELARKQGLEALKAKELADEALEKIRADEDNRDRLAEKLQDLARVLSATCDQLRDEIYLSEQGAQEQSAQAEETAASMEEMNAAAREISTSAAHAAGVAEAAREKASSGAGVVEEMVGSIVTVHSHSEKLRDSMQSLGEQAQGINTILSVISEIADQTNLLALNAAIEAARAGEAGRGFSVVADEVRKLAEKTMRSAADVGAVIRQIQASTTSNLEQMDNTSKVVESARELAGQAGQTLNEIVEHAADAAGQIFSISTAATQQDLASEEIARSITRISVISGDTLQNMQQATKAVQNLVTQAETMREMIASLQEEHGAEEQS